jgi:hypothetical protein
LDENFECIYNLEEVDHFLNDFTSDRRIQAFSTSTRLVEFYIRAFGLLTFFESMTVLSKQTELPTTAYSGSQKACAR